VDIKEQIEKMAKKVLADEDLMKQFKKDPVKAAEKILGVDLPDDIIEKVVDGVKAKIAVDVNCTPFVRQYDILSNKRGVLLCQKECQTKGIQQNSRNM